MKSLASYITEAAADRSFIKKALALDPAKPEEVAKFFQLFFDNGVSIHPDDSFKDNSFGFTQDECEQLDNWFDKAFRALGDKVYEIGSDTLTEFWKKNVAEWESKNKKS